MSGQLIENSVQFYWRVLDTCFENLPVDLTPLLSRYNKEASGFLDGNLLERLVVTLFNEEDDRISSLETKAQVIGLLKAIARTSRRGKVRIRLLIHPISPWIDVISASLSNGLVKILKELVGLMCDIWHCGYLSDSLCQQFDKGASIESIKLYILKIFAATQFQAITRSCLARIRLKRSLALEREAQRDKLKEWSIVNLQKVARGYITRKAITRPLLIRKHLNRDLLRLTEKHLAKGDLWGFLQDINNEMLYVKNQMVELEQREDYMASKFVNEVVKLREDEFDEAWKKFPDMVSKHVKDMSPFGLINDGSIVQRNLNSHLPPGPLVRKALSSTVDYEVEQKLTNIINKEFSSVKHAQSLQHIYGNAIQSSASTQIVSSKKGKTKKVRNTLLSTTPYAISNASNDSLVEYNTKSTDIYNEQSLLLEIPLGYEDSLEKLLYAAAMRTYIPDFFLRSTNATSLSAAEAYAQYLRLPEGLAKIRYELECKKSAQGVINKLKVQGFSRIEELYPVSKFTTCLKNVQAAWELVKGAADIFVLLKNIKKKEKALLSSTNSNVLALTNSTADQNMCSVVNSSSKSSPSRPNASKTKGLATMNNIPRPLSSSKQTKEDLTQSPLFIPHPLAPKETVNENATKLLESLLQTLGNSHSVEEILVHNAFLILPHKKAQKEEEVMGQRGFQAFAADFLSPSCNEVEREEMVRQRFRASVMLTSPYTITLKERGVHTPEQLINADLSSLNLPPALHQQLEIYNNSMNYQKSSAKILEVPRDYEAVLSKNAYMVPMFYDTRYQRTPLDPYGKTPLKSKLPLRAVPRKERDGEEGRIGESLWEQEEEEGQGEGEENEKREEENMIGWKFVPSLEGKESHIHEIKQNKLDHTPAKKKIKPPHKSSPSPKPASISLPPIIHSHPSTNNSVYVCPHPHCGQSFSRAYTYKVHLKSHDQFPKYHEYKRNPQLGLDDLS